MKILFLDIDGVLNSERSSLALGGYPHSFEPADLAKFDWVAVGLIREFCKVSECSIVLSSTWRMYRELMERAAEALDLPIIDRTPDHGSYDTRASEIAAWLAEHPEVTRFAIVDDVPVFDSHPELYANFVQTDPNMGMTLATYRALRMVIDPLRFD